MEVTTMRLTYTEWQRKESQSGPVRLALLGLLVATVAISGCTAGGSMLALQATSVELAEDNFDYVARDVMGSSHAAYLIGISSSAGARSNTFALARVDGTATLYNDAVEDLWRNFRDEYGGSEGSLVLANIRYDTDILNLLIYTKTTLYIHADVVAFRGE